MAGQRLIEQGEKRRSDILDFIEGYERTYTRGPTISEIAEGVGLRSPNATRQHLRKLCDDGLITMEARVARAIHSRRTRPAG